MTTAPSALAAAAPAQSFLQRHYFLVRRLHSLTGIVPIGVFLMVHLLTNSSVAWGKLGLRGQHPELDVRQGGVAYFWKEVLWINEQIPHLILVEWILWISIAYHSILGVYFALQGRNNVSHYGYQANWRYTLQRISGYVGILFIFYHIASLRWGWTWLIPGGAKWGHMESASTLAEALRGGSEGVTAAGLIVSLFYFVGVSLLVFHFANGLWTAAITWGVTVSAKAQKQWGYICAALGAGLMLAAWASVIGFATLDPATARAAEKVASGATGESPLKLQQPH